MSDAVRVDDAMEHLTTYLSDYVLSKYPRILWRAIQI